MSGTTPQSVIDNWGERDTPPVEVNLNVTTENEVIVGGEYFSVRIRSHAPLGDLVRHAEALLGYRPAEGKTPTAGFSLPVADARPTDDQRGSSAPHPVQPIQ